MRLDLSLFFLGRRYGFFNFKGILCDKEFFGMFEDSGYLFIT